MDRRPGSEDLEAERHQDRIDAAEEARAAAELDEDDWDEEEDDEDSQDATAFGPDGKLRVLTERCSTCIFRPGNLMHLSPGRVADMVRTSVARDAYITCHQTLPYGDHPAFGGAVCRGFFDGHGHRVNVIRIMGRLGGIAEVAPPVKEEAR